MNDKIVELIKSGLSYKDISEKFGVTTNSIRCRCFRLGVKSSDYKKDKKIINCLECGCDTTNKKFCCKSCSSTYNNKNRIKNKKLCLNCNNELSRSSSKYCCQRCQFDFEYKLFIQKWKNGEIDGNTGKYKDNLSTHIRKYLFIKYDNKCAKCGWNEVNQYTGNIPLEIDHIDGNHLNSVEENLIALCPSCHSLTQFYGSRNKGRGRKYRKK